MSNFTPSIVQPRILELCVCVKLGPTQTRESMKFHECLDQSFLKGRKFLTLLPSSLIFLEVSVVMSDKREL